MPLGSLKVFQEHLKLLFLQPTVTSCHGHTYPTLRPVYYIQLKYCLPMSPSWVRKAYFSNIICVAFRGNVVLLIQEKYPGQLALVSGQTVSEGVLRKHHLRSATLTRESLMNIMIVGKACMTILTTGSCKRWVF